MSARNDLKTKLISIAASLALAVGLIPLTAFAEATDGAEGTSAETGVMQRPTAATSEPATTTDEAATEEPAGSEEASGSEPANPTNDSKAAAANEGALTAMNTPNPSYSVKFDPNVPANASTACSGTMENQSFAYAEKKALSENGYSLPGYDFNGWNTKADGTGTAYADKAEVQSLTDDGSVVVLYAQWSGKAYTIVYQSDGSGSQQHERTAYFDQSGKLDRYSDNAFGWNSGGMKLHGWAGTGYGSFLKDGDDFCNLCGEPDADGNVADAVLTADWVQNGQIIVSVTKDGMPQEGLANYLELAQGSVTIPVPVVYQNGKYVFDPMRVPTSEGSVAQLPPDEYDIRFGTIGYPPASARITYGEEHAVSVVFDYYTVSLTKDSAYADFNEVEANGGEGNTIIMRDGDMLGIKTILAQGYRFVYYSAVGVAPIWEGGDPSKVNQAIEVQGTAIISAHVSPIEYSVTFANDDGTVLQNGRMAYGEMPEYTGATPTKPATAQHTFTFSGWTPEIAAVTGDVTYTAMYSSTLNKYKVTFVDEDGTVLKAATEYGYGTPATDIEKPDVPAKITPQYTYTFAGWSPEVAYVTKDATYKATYDKELNKYKVTFVDEDGTVLKAAAEYGYGTNAAEIAKPADPAKAADAKYTYTFAGWTPEITDVTADATYKATYSKTAKAGSYEVASGDGSTWTKGSTDPITLTIKGAVGDAAIIGLFKGVEVDGEAVPEKDASGKANWTAKKGSLILSLQPSYLETLADGDHTVKALFDDGTGEATFTVAAKDAPEPAAGADTASATKATPSAKQTSSSPKTGDANGGTVAALSVTAACALCLSLVALSQRRRRRHARSGKHARG